MQTTRCLYLKNNNKKKKIGGRGRDFSQKLIYNLQDSFCLLILYGVQARQQRVEEGITIVLEPMLSVLLGVQFPNSFLFPLCRGVILTIVLRKITFLQNMNQETVCSFGIVSK